MADMTPFETLNEVARRSAEAVIAQSGIAHEGLRRRLREMLQGQDASAGALLGEPALEGAHPFVSAAVDMQGLAGSILNADLVAALDGLSDGHEYRFPRSRRPFQHQLEAWRRLSAPEPQSVLVTSGTGSGKTECFLLPILSDLAAQAHSQTLEGVQAIMLYPLNALIESQRERLSAWTIPFKGRIRYGLYNGDMDRSARESDRRLTPERVIDRERLRQSPPPLLVTNVTMLEYMLVRADDRPILEASRGRLKWIVLDEAHSLVGAAAAEIALLLRRVMLAFAVEPDQVRFIATSATIGSGDEVKERLQRFLADVAGISEARVHVIEGKRRLPARPGGGAAPARRDLRDADPAYLFEALGRDGGVWTLVERLHQGAVTLSAFDAPARRFGVTASELVLALARAEHTSPGGESKRLAPIRLHAFERASPGLWSCVNPVCKERTAEWPFGALRHERADACAACGAPTLEIVSCVECGEVYFDAVETKGRLSAPLRQPPRDEFRFDSATESQTDEDEEEEAAAAEPPPQWEHLFAVNATATARPFWLNLNGWGVAEAPQPDGLTLSSVEHSGLRACPHCRPGGRADGEAMLRPLRFGAPFLLGNAAPILLEGVEPAPPREGEKLPSDGRRLLSFTDSRQGTARMAAKLQIESERNFVRSFVYHQVQASMQPEPGKKEEAGKLRAELAKLEALAQEPQNAILRPMVEQKRTELAAIIGASRDGVAWPDLVERLARRIETREWIKSVWQERDEETFKDATAVARFLLLREFARRPRRANSVETLGLARLRNPAVDRLQDAHLPTPFRARRKTLADWREYLDTVLTGFVRANSAIDIAQNMQHWISPRTRTVTLVGPGRKVERDSGLRFWPSGFVKGRISRPAALLIRGLGLSPSEAADRDDLGACLQAAWDQLQPAFSSDPERRIYDFDKTFVAPLIDAYFCPATRRVIDRAPFGLTPYGLDEALEARRRAQPIALPRHPAPLLGLDDPASARAATREWLVADETVAALKNKGAWRDLNDRVALFADYARSAEHSAQQMSRRLRLYEKDFKAGLINILNCSTTMEMGVDIGSVASVMMTNAPPSIANYRQRVGRAGRRGQALALAFTFCKDRPLDREAFRDPLAYLSRTVAAPRVTLSSRPIVQRHVNAFLLSAFLTEQSGDAIKMQIGAFLGCPADSKLGRPPKKERPVEAFVEWLERPGVAEAFHPGLVTLTRRSVLEGDARLIEDACEAIRDLSESFVSEWEGLIALAKDEGLQDAGKSRMGLELRRLCEEFLLGALADRGFLPGHGFPTDVVAFLPGKEYKPPQTSLPDGSRTSRSLGPQRSLDLAIRDYAPGSEVVLDGLVYRSAGVTLNWKRPASAEGVAEIQSLRHFWRCSGCGASDVERVSAPSFCSVCGGDELQRQEYLRPAGFSVDPRERAHAETDTLTFVAPEEPKVSTRGGSWTSLAAPELGRYRCSREGLVYYANRGGEGGSGFAVCLQCGRAEADGEGPALKDHKPLRWLKGVTLCPGNDKPFSIRRNLSLGRDVVTDVFELQPRCPLPRAAATALVIALREALARRLGVEADEMGFAVARSENALGGDAASLFLFDRPAGGAGFAVSLEFAMPQVFEEAQRILDCRTPGCERACAACVLTGDAPDSLDALDRKAALAFLREHLAFPGTLAQEDLYAPGATLSLAPLDEIDRALRDAARATVTLFAPETTKLSKLSEWSLLAQSPAWRLRGHKLRLVTPPKLIDAATAAERLALRDFALQHGFELVRAEAPAFDCGALAMVAVEAEGAEIWVSPETDARRPGPLWGRPVDRPLGRVTAPFALNAEPIALEALLPPPSAQFRDIGAELDGDLTGFGGRVADLIVELLKGCRNWPAGGLSQAVYCDPYVSSPLAARLVIDTVRALFAMSGSAKPTLKLMTRPPRDFHSRTPWRFDHDWRDARDHKASLESFGAQCGLRLELTQGETPHGRYLELMFADGNAATVVLDQGFGAWGLNTRAPLRFDFQADPATQASKLKSATAFVQRRGPGKTYIVARRGRR